MLSAARQGEHFAKIFFSSHLAFQVGQDAIRSAIVMSKFMPPMAFLGPDYIKSFGDKYGEMAFFFVFLTVPLFTTRYLSSVEKLETNRARQGEFVPFVAYLLDVRSRSRFCFCFQFFFFFCFC